MSDYPENPVLTISPPKEGSISRNWGTFTYGPKMPWGEWLLTSEPTQLVEFESITVLECRAREMVDDEHGVAAEEACLCYFLVGRKADGTLAWWHNIGSSFYDLDLKKIRETSIRTEDGKIFIKGYDRDIEPDQEVTIDIISGEKTMPK